MTCRPMFLTLSDIYMVKMGNDIVKKHRSLPYIPYQDDNTNRHK